MLIQYGQLFNMEVYDMYINDKRIVTICHKDLNKPYEKAYNGIYYVRCGSA